jgi:hypothetical protein
MQAHIGRRARCLNASGVMVSRRVLVAFFTKRDFYPDLDGKSGLKVIQESIEKVKELGFIKETIDVSKHADLSLIEEATRRRRNGN